MLHYKEKKLKERIISKQDAVRRLKIVNGHVGRVIKMVEDGVYCIDILQQTSAIRSALKKVEGILLVNHLNHCVVDALKSGADKKTTEELERVFDKLS